MTEKRFITPPTILLKKDKWEDIWLLLLGSSKQDSQGRNTGERLVSKKDINELENNPELKERFKMIPTIFKRGWDNNINQNVIPTNFSWQIETDDKLYQIKINNIIHDKHTCDECIYYDDGCLKDKELVSVERKIYCRKFTGEKRCWDCEYYQSWGGDDYYCDYPDWDFDDSYEFIHEDNWNEKGKCPKFKVEL